MDELQISTVSSGKINSTAVVIRDAYKQYSNAVPILKGLNMTLPAGTIYGLLGPSGCGKTTLLSCIVGRISLDSGSIELNVTRRSHIGYMPQDLTLHDQLSIFETFNFYGYIFGMTQEQIQSRAIDLLEFLELPSGHRFISSLSGGQQRRVSVAVSLLHDPQLLILDEPTVGLDPVLSQSIWVRLLQMAAKGKSIIITTHYIQEARQAHTIGLMRGGVLLAEQPPEKLMEMCGSDNLEDAFLFLSHRQEENRTEQIKKPIKSKPVMPQFEDDDKFFSKTKYKGVMYKNVTLLRREYVFIAFVLVLPVLQTFLFNIAIGRKPKNLPIAVVNDETNYQTCTRDWYQGCFLDAPHNVSISCLYLDFLKNRTYNLVEYNNNAVALDDVRKNKVWGILHFSENYTAALANRIGKFRGANSEDVEYGNVESWIDLSNQYIGNMVRHDIVLSLLAFLQQALLDCNVNPKVGMVPIHFEKPIFGSMDENFISYASTAILVLCCFFFPTILTAGLILTEKLGGIIERMMVSGITVMEMTAAIIVIQMVVHVLQTTLVMIVMYCVFDNPMIGDLATLIALLILIGFSGTFFGFMLAVVNSEITMTAYLGICSNIFLCFTCGLIWPVEAEHYLLKSISWLLPLTLTTDAARAITLKSFPFLHPTVFGGFISIVAWNMIFIGVIVAAVKIKKDIWTVHK